MSIEQARSTEESFVEASRFIEVLTGAANSPVTLQTFLDSKESGGGVATIRHGSLADHWEALVRLNQAGHGIFVMVNKGDGQGRSSKNVTGLRALFTDDDGTREGPPPSTDAAPPSMVVQSAHGQHTYWLLEPGEPLTAFSSAQEALAGHFKTDPMVKDLPRVMRVPGFFHQKDPAHPFLVTVVDTKPVRYTIQQLLTAFPGGTAPANEPRVRGAAPTVRPEKKADRDFALRRARGYLSKIDGAVQGEHGDDATYTVACVLKRDFDLSFDDALTLFREWNEKCTPPWRECDLVEKLQNADRYANGTRGAKLNAAPADFRGTEDLCFVVPLSRYFARNARGEWDTSRPLDEKGAKGHLVR
jgi:hypothetical protein